jgi:nucleotide-binding universal stress UspA family protein
MKRIRRIVHPSDFSTASRPAFARALDLARANRATLTLVHVMPPVIPIVGDGYVSPQVWEDVERTARAYAQKQIDKLIARARQAGVRAKSVLLEGVPADRIVRTAKGQRADVIVMGTHGRSGLAKLFLGSVAERVVATAPCPVMTVRGR